MSLILVLFFAFFSNNLTKAQTTLVRGDMSMISSDAAAGPDNSSEASTAAKNMRRQETELIWTPTSALPAGAAEIENTANWTTYSATFMTSTTAFQQGTTSPSVTKSAVSNITITGTTFKVELTPDGGEMIVESFVSSFGRQPKLLLFNLSSN